MNLLPEIPFQGLALLSRSRREGLARHDRQWRQLPLNRAHAKALRMLKIKHKRTRPYTPRTNGKAERFVQTSLREWAKLTKGSSRRSLLEWSAEGYAKPYNHSSEPAAALLPFLPHYNHHRPHFGINGCTPISRISTNNLSRHDS
jgi:transposase InsO family protein